MFNIRMAKVHDNFSISVTFSSTANSYSSDLDSCTFVLRWTFRLPGRVHGVDRGHVCTFDLSSCRTQCKVSVMYWWNYFSCNYCTRNTDWSLQDWLQITPICEQIIQISFVNYVIFDSKMAILAHFYLKRISWCLETYFGLFLTTAWQDLDADYMWSLYDTCFWKYWIFPIFPQYPFIEIVWRIAKCNSSKLLLLYYEDEIHMGLEGRERK